jgi:hypothetical protein
LRKTFDFEGYIPSLKKIILKLEFRWKKTKKYSACGEDIYGDIAGVAPLQKTCVICKETLHVYNSEKCIIVYSVQ